MKINKEPTYGAMLAKKKRGPFVLIVSMKTIKDTLIADIICPGGLNLTVTEDFFTKKSIARALVLRDRLKRLWQ